MVEPRVIPRDAHTVSRRDIDPDALKVLYRLRQGEHIAYLVGGSVRDLLLGRRPKDFDIGTSAHPYQVKKLFRNCWIIGRRFRLAHVKFGTKVIEVATFRRQVQPGEEVTQEIVIAPNGPAADGPTPSAGDAEALLHHDNTFGTPEEDAFRRDFTINALFYDIATFSVIDYVDGLDDLRAGLVRSIGDPEVRFREDPVRMLRAVALAARLDFTIEPPDPRRDRGAAPRNRAQLTAPSARGVLQDPARGLGRENIPHAGGRRAARTDFTGAAPRRGAGRCGDRSPASTAIAASSRRTPDTLTNAILLGSLLMPLGLSPQSGRPVVEPTEGRRPRPIGPRLGELPLARRDVERLRQILGLQRRLRDFGASVRAQRALTHRSIFREALTWMEIHGGTPETVEHWITVLAERGAEEPVMAPDRRGPTRSLPRLRQTADAVAGAGDAGRGPPNNARRRLLRSSCRVWRA